MMSRDEPELEGLPLPYELALAWQGFSRQSYAAHLDGADRKLLTLEQGCLACIQGTLPATCAIVFSAAVFVSL